MFRDGFGDNRLGALGGLQGGVAGHNGDTTRVGAQGEGGEVCVSGVEPDIESVETQDFGNYGCENVVRSLTDLTGAGEHSDAAAAVELQLHSGLRHFVPIDREPGARQISGARQSNTSTLRKSPEFVIPARDLDHAANAFGEIDGAQAEKIGGYRVGRFDDAQAKLGGVNLELLGDLVELDFLTEARLDSAMAAFRATGGLVGEGAATLKAIAGDVIRRGLQCAGVESAGNAIGAIGTTVD